MLFLIKKNCWALNKQRKNNTFNDWLMKRWNSWNESANYQQERKFKSFMSIIPFRDLLVKYQQTNHKSTFYLINKLRKFDLEKKRDELLVNLSSLQLNQLMQIQTFNRILTKKLNQFNVGRPKSLTLKFQKWMLKRLQQSEVLNSEILFKMESFLQVCYVNQLKSHIKNLTIIVLKTRGVRMNFSKNSQQFMIKLMKLWMD